MQCRLNIDLVLHIVTFVYLYTSHQSELPSVNVAESGPEYEFWETDTEEEAERRRRETERGRGSVEFVHPDLKEVNTARRAVISDSNLTLIQELNKQGEDPNNPWVWLTSYSRIPVSVKCWYLC